MSALNGLFKKNKFFSIVGIKATKDFLFNFWVLNK